MPVAVTVFQESALELHCAHPARHRSSAPLLLTAGNRPLAAHSLVWAACARLLCLGQAGGPGARSSANTMEMKYFAILYCPDLSRCVCHSVSRFVRPASKWITAIHPSSWSLSAFSAVSHLRP